MPLTKEQVTFDDDVWAYENLSVDDCGYVTGSAYTQSFDGEHDVQIGVFSYEYERSGETRMNHVPTVVVANSDGKVVAEPYASDSENPRRAIQNARNAAEYVYEHYEQFV